MAKVTWTDEVVTAEMVVVAASFRMDIKRVVMQDEAMKLEYPDVHAMALATFTYPRLICATPSGQATINGVAIDWPPTSDQVLDMSAALVNAWFAEVERCNPDWFPKPPEVGTPTVEGEEPEKKVQEKSPTSDS
jgi:hypothetical protein